MYNILLSLNFHFSINENIIKHNIRLSQINEKQKTSISLLNLQFLIKFQTQLRKALPHLVADTSYQNIGVQSPRLEGHDGADYIRVGDSRAPVPVYQEPGTLQQPVAPFQAPRPQPNNNWIPHQNPAAVAQNQQYTG